MRATRLAARGGAAVSGSPSMTAAAGATISSFQDWRPWAKFGLSNRLGPGTSWAIPTEGRPAAIARRKAAWKRHKLGLSFEYGRQDMNNSGAIAGSKAVAYCLTRKRD